MQASTPAPARSGPAWVGIGAQRCGTTWFTQMLAAHPQVALGFGGRKEVHFFERFLVEPWTDAEAERYRAAFPDGVASGEFTPSYLRSTWVAPLLRSVCRDDTKLVVLLRDPVERFRSAMRWAHGQPNVPRPDDQREFRRWIRRTGNTALWAGMYATQLDAWRRHFPQDRFLVLPYERLAADPQAALGGVWRALGLEPVPVEASREPTWNATRADAWTMPEALSDHVRDLYRGEVERLRGEWGIDTSLWRHFA